MTKVFFVRDNYDLFNHIPVKVSEVVGFSPHPDFCEIHLTGRRRVSCRNKFSEKTSNNDTGTMIHMDSVRELYLNATEAH
jgi:hypothetical protein